MNKPYIGITAYHSRTTGVRGSYITGHDYVASVISAGGVPLLLPENGDKAAAEQYVEICDGILLPGGDDVHPALYGEQPEPGLRNVYMTIDNFECALIHAAYRLGKPVFGICRGIQIINVAYGGTLVQDIPRDLPSADSHYGPADARDEPYHEITTVDGSLMRRVFGERIMTNSYHHQAVKTVAQGFDVTAQTSDGVIEAIEHESKHVFGVQFHPENFSFKYDDFANLFRVFCEMCSRNKSNGEI